MILSRRSIILSGITVAAAGATHRILPIDEIAQAITARVTRADQFIEGRTA